MLPAFEFHPQLIIRLPARPFDAHIGQATIDALRDDPAFLEALYLASPVLWAECRKWQRGELTDPRRLHKLRHSLTRYYVRATTRCTPFGLFAGCAAVRWGESSHLRLAAAPARRTRLDMHYLCALAQHLAAQPSLRARLRYWPNTSLYAAGPEFRYVEYQYQEGERVYQLSAVEAAPHVVQVLEAARSGCCYTELQSKLTADAGPVREAEATQFLDELIQAQVLVHELEPTVTGPEYLDYLRATLARLLAEEADPELAALLDTLAEVSRQLRALDAAAVSDPLCYEQVAALLAPLGVRPETNKLFQTDSGPLLDPAAHTVAQAVQADLLGALAVLHRLTPSHPPARLADFARRFAERYENQEIPLLEALDSESGLAYANQGASAFAPLVHDLLVPLAEVAPAPSSGPAQQLVARKVLQATQAGHYHVALTDEDLHACPAPALPLPPSLALVFRLLDDGGTMLEYAGGSSAANLLGRFAHANPAIGQLVADITAREQASNPGVVFAEICHLPASRVGNVLLRPSFRRRELAYLAQAAVPAEQQVRPQDLLLAIRGGELVLRSRVSGERIVPRLSTAHNFTQQALPVYQFLCDLQTQGVQAQLGLGWLNAADGTRFVPRLTYGRVVLAPATWYFEAADLHPLLTPATDLPAALAAFRQQWRLPRWFVLAEGDHELLVDADNAWLVRNWLEAVRPLARIQLKEYLLNPAISLVRDVAGHPYAQQFVALLLGQQAVYPAARPTVLPSADVNREFSLGSEWLYYKLYCGQQQASTLLLTLVEPLTVALQAAGLVDYWFFVRYADPDNHLRLRLHLPDPAQVGAVVQCVADHLRPFQANRVIWKVQADTYRRELERYGSRTMALSECLFGWQSQTLLAWLTEAATQAEPVDYWLWGLGAVEELLQAFGCPLAQKEALLGELQASFAREFHLDKPLRRQLDAKYRAIRPALTAYLTAVRPVPPALAALATNIRAALTAGPVEVELPALLAAYLHMLLNRVLPAEARLHELALYDFLHRYYQAALARSGVSSSG